jgi:BirA family transcriptional regulator, biotin operon repressor / biotin---[acetyl-CoA-carboxylase] ligase
MLALIATGVEEGLWLRAERQTEGRGRLGRGWESPSGNLFASTLVHLRPTDPPAPMLAFVAAVALVEVLKAQAPLEPFLLKWPNDVLCDGAKLAGILLERTGDTVVIGIGVNLAHHPEGLDRSVTSLAARIGQAPDAEAFVHSLAAHFASWLVQWRESGQAAIIGAWHRYAHMPGTPLSVNLPDGSRLAGCYDGLDQDGALKLRLADGAVRAIHAGDVFLV